LLFCVLCGFSACLPLSFSTLGATKLRTKQKPNQSYGFDKGFSNTQKNTRYKNKAMILCTSFFLRLFSALEIFQSFDFFFFGKSLDLPSAAASFSYSF